MSRSARLRAAKGLMSRAQLDEILRQEVLTPLHYSIVHKPMSEP